MILQALNGYYERLLTDPGADISEFGFANEDIDSVIELSVRGIPLGVTVLDQPKSSYCPSPAVSLSSLRKSEFPMAYKRTSGVAAYFMADKGEYAIPGSDIKKHNEFKGVAKEVIGEANSAELTSFLLFLDCSDEYAEKLSAFDKEIYDRRKVAFRLQGRTSFLHECQEAIDKWKLYLNGVPGKKKGTCLISGKKQFVLPVHPPIRNKRNALASKKGELSIVSFNFDATVSYGKEQSFNAPVSERAAFAYTTALNHLLAPESPRKLRVGDTTVVFWTEARGQAEKFFNFAMGGKYAEDDSLAKRLEGYLSAVAKGKYPEELGDAKTRFYVLGLSPNAARLSVRFWHVGTVGGVAERIGQYFSDQELDHNYTFTKYPSIKSLFYALAPYRKDKDTNRYKAAELTQSTEDRCSSVVNDFLLSVLNGERYPKQLFNMVLQRLRKDTCTDGFNGFVRLAFLKAYLIQSKQEVPVSLDSNSKEYGYVLGRLFATVENIQRAASKTELNTTLRDRYFTGAMSSPSRVFVPLIQNAFDNLPKLRKSESGLYGYFEKTLNEIMNKIEISDGLKHTLKPEEQGQFVIGYFHQRSFKKDKNTED